MSESRRDWQPVMLGGDVPTPAGAYSPGVRAGDFLFVSGQIPKDPKTGAIVGDDVAAQTRQVVSNIEAVLKAGGAGLENVVSVTVYLSDPDLWAGFNAAYKELMPQPYPSRTAIGCGLRGILVEISAVAYLPR
jgi:2-iminobutanoate/2-iminopropanoate deaminase